MSALDFIRQDDQNRLLLQQQLNKDFQASNLIFPPDFVTSLYSWEELYLLVEAQLIALMERGERPFLQLLYQIDLPEHKFLQLLGSADLSRSITEAVIRREAEKIYFRHKFRS